MSSAYFQFLETIVMQEVCEIVGKFWKSENSQLKL